MATESGEVRNIDDLKKHPVDFKDDLQKFNPKEGLKHVTCTEKVVLPSKEDVVQERQHMQLIDGVETFNKAGLHHLEVAEKNELPTKEAIAEEKKEAEFRKSIEKFDATSQLKHVDPPKEKTRLPSQTDIEKEKKETQ